MVHEYNVLHCITVTTVMFKYIIMQVITGSPAMADA